MRAGRVVRSIVRACLARHPGGVDAAARPHTQTTKEKQQEGEAWRMVRWEQRTDGTVRAAAAVRDCGVIEPPDQACPTGHSGEEVAAT
ncbi:hypothetical protein NDU88_006071 [Pleurodeles waltl]|uniref:Uncharacterized protein n=1 Tax=Pleurodeles waltl TaxID=8319 RepID=A0AAV7MB60_PLEWA|nr:hypothetical protein NDU88_006071 [Pleurodeles waltl]